MKNMRIVPEFQLRQLKLAAPLDIDLIGSVNQNIANRRVGEQRLDWPQPDHLVDDFVRKAVLRHLIEQQLLVIGNLAHQAVHETGKLFLRHTHSG